MGFSRGHERNEHAKVSLGRGLRDMTLVAAITTAGIAVSTNADTGETLDTSEFKEELRHARQLSRAFQKVGEKEAQVREQQLREVHKGKFL